MDRSSGVRRKDFARWRMPSRRLALVDTKSESRVARNLSTFSGKKDRESRSSYVQLVRVGKKARGWGQTIFEANTELRHSAFSRVELAVVSEGRDGRGAA